MMMIKTTKNFGLTACLLIAFTANAQQQIIQSSINKITNSAGISYKISETSTDPFGGNDQRAEMKVTLCNRLSDNNYESYLIDCDASYGKFKYLGNSDHQLELNMKDGTYVMQPREGNKSYTDPLNSLAKDLNKKINETRYITQMLEDTTINNSDCYHLFVYWDNSSKKKKLYDRIHVFVNKVDNMILGVVSDQQTEVPKGGIIVTAQITHKASYSAYKFSAKAPGPKDFSIPAGFKPGEKAPLLLDRGATARIQELPSTGENKR